MKLLIQYVLRKEENRQGLMGYAWIHMYFCIPMNEIMRPSNLSLLFTLCIRHCFLLSRFIEITIVRYI